jgi:hypothetical protein
MMRRLHAVVLMGLLFSSCSRPEGGLIRDASDEPDYADYWKRQLSEHPIPQVSIQRADAYFDSLPFAQRTPHRNKVRAEFSRGFFSGFTNPAGEIVGGEHDARWHGFKSGQDYRRSNPESLKEIMEAFGYTAIEADGIWTVGFEHSGFRPRGQTTDGTWWLLGFGSTQGASRKDFEISDGGVAVHVVGFRSPIGSYGHLGSYNYQFYYTKIGRIETPNPAER